MRWSKHAPGYRGRYGPGHHDAGLNRILDQAMAEATRLKDEYVSAEHVLVAMSEDKAGRGGQSADRPG